MADNGDLFEVSDQAENLSDIENFDPKIVSQAVVSGTDWTTETIISQINKGNIQLNPRFQRRDAWERERKSQFIESLILGLPIPQLVLAESKTKRGSYIVIDGKQRLLSIRQFAAEPDDKIYQRLQLTGLNIRDDLRKLSLFDLRADAARSDDLAAFENQPIRTIVIKNWGNDNFLYQVFLRLNTGSVPLSPQELRQALHPGDFVEFADLASGESKALRDLLKLKKPDFRMRDAELLIRWYAFQYFGDRYNGDLKGFLDHTCAELNSWWPQSQNEIIGKLEDFEAAYSCARDIFGDNVCRKWTSDGYERPFNRAIFDFIMYYFAMPNVRERAIPQKEAVELAFRRLCETNADFLGSIERTTKSIGATSLRFSIWAEELGAVLGIALRSPVLRVG
ncbi:MAG: DUF262 domain-containing protein [Bosea sp.]|uniref:DUF262 domain-containing protein n=1 Tax=Bosea sp. (in: a-proteobacteria) TaxID=1871050 RepID=UPI001ACFD804|nr:DUF262 domain-containing protein [Bosea sp. (in: a-proteobacteria)]MBN9452943.1 DUF262 domain-containing protein [Bosea sp. (in: a-proteobacteria)]